MDPNQNDYHISFFKPTTPQAKWNRNLAIKLILIWAVAVFGFHLLLRAIEKPTPEETYIKYEQVWDNISSENATVEEMQVFANASLTVLGKVFIKPEEKSTLMNALSWTTFQLADSSQKAQLQVQLTEFEKLKTEDVSISDPAYIEAKDKLSTFASGIIGLDRSDVRSKLISVSLSSAQLESFSETSKSMIPTIMSTYLIHNQSVLTDFIFLGFPFHYFYTAVFLLILFVFLCWLYCVRVDAMNVKLDIEE
jgi:putative solute:sodium symporter small subunit